MKITIQKYYKTEDNKYNKEYFLHKKDNQSEKGGWVVGENCIEK